MKFEALAEAPEDTVSHLCAALGLEFEAPMLQVPHWGSSTVTHSNSKVGVSAQVKEQWRNVLTAAECSTVVRLSGSLMQRAGYQLDETEGSIGLRQWLSYGPHLLGVALANPKRALTVAKGMLGA